MILISEMVASSPGPSQILSRSRGEKAWGSKLRHRPEMVDSVSTNRVHHFQGPGDKASEMANLAAVGWEVATPARAKSLDKHC